MYFRNYRLPKAWLDHYPLSKKRRLRISFESQHVKGYEMLVKSAWEHFYQIFSSLWNKMIWNIYALSKFEMLMVLVKKLTADDKYPARDCEKLPFSIETQLS